MPFSSKRTAARSADVGSASNRETYAPTVLLLSLSIFFKSGPSADPRAPVFWAPAGVRAGPGGGFADGRTGGSPGVPEGVLWWTPWGFPLGPASGLRRPSVGTRS